MKIVSLAAVFGAVLVSVPALADTITSRIVKWNPSDRQLTLADRTLVELDPTKVTLPESMEPGDEIVISYVGTEDGISRVISVTTRKPAVAPAN